MRIDLNLGNLEQLHETSTRRPAESARGAKSIDKGDKADLSSSGSGVSQLTAAAMAMPEVRAERVNELRQAMVQGTYRFEPKAIAEAILRDLV